MGVWGLCPQRGLGADPLVRGSGGRSPPEAEHNYTFHKPIFAKFWCPIGKIQSFCKLLKLGLGSFLHKHKRCCFDKLIYVRSIGFTLRESTRYTIYTIMSITLQRYLWLRNTKYTHNNNHQQVRNNSYLTNRDKTGHNYRENSEISDRLFNSVNPSLHERCGSAAAAQR